MPTYTMYNTAPNDGITYWSWPSSAIAALTPAQAGAGSGSNSSVIRLNDAYVADTGPGVNVTASNLSWQENHFWFDTSPIPDNETITSVTLSVYMGAHDGPVAQVVQNYITDSNAGLDTFANAHRTSRQVAALPIVSSTTRASGVGAGTVNLDFTAQGVKHVKRKSMTKMLLVLEHQVTESYIPKTVIDSTVSNMLFADYGGTSFTPKMTIVTGAAGATIPATPTVLLTEKASGIELGWNSISPTATYVVYHNGIQVATPAAGETSLLHAPGTVGIHSYSMGSIESGVESDLSEPQFIQWTGTAYDGEVFSSRPTSDISASRWTTNTGSATGLYATLDEEFPDDTDFIKIGTN